MASRPDLFITRGELKGRRFSVGEGGLRLGRSSSNDIHISDEELSRNHCLFERVGEAGIRLTDLASANGTFVNGKQLGIDPALLKEGDVVEVGQQCISVGEPPSAPDRTIDLGLGAGSATGEAAPSTPVARRSPLVNLFWGVAILIAASAIALILLMPTQTSSSSPIVSTAKEVEPILREVVYEKVRADANGIFRYALKFTASEGLAVSLADTANDRRMPEKSRVLSAEDQAALNEILNWRLLKELAGDYTGITPDPPALDSVLLKVIYTTGVLEISVVNTEPSERLEMLLKRLEAFSQVQLGVSAMAYSREELIRRANSATTLGDLKWEERDIDYGNLAAAILAYEEALHYLETVSPKPECASIARTGLLRAKEERDHRCTDRRINAEKEIGVRNWERAREELQIILRMVPEREDDRHRAAASKLLEVENNLKRQGGGR